MTDDGITHRLWRLTDPAGTAAIAADLAGRTALIADGHHRYAAYRELRAVMRGRRARRRAVGLRAGVPRGRGRLPAPARRDPPGDPAPGPGGRGTPGRAGVHRDRAAGDLAGPASARPGRRAGPAGGQAAAARVPARRAVAGFWLLTEPDRGSSRPRCRRTRRRAGGPSTPRSCRNCCWPGSGRSRTTSVMC